MEEKSKSSIISLFGLGFVKALFNISYFGRQVISGKADSGVTFDHVYLNQSKGYFPVFGKIVDRIILNLPSLEATRARWRYISDQVVELAPEVTRDCGALRIIDLASGASRYLVDLAKLITRYGLECVCVDRDREAIYLGKKISNPNYFRYCRSNLFASRRLLKFGLNRDWRPQIAVATGFIEYLDEEFLTVLLENLHNFLVEGGYLIISTQIKNPSQRLMEGICRTNDGKPWKLFYREPRFIRTVLESHGFLVTKIHIDKLGMYSIFTAQSLPVKKKS